MQCVLVQAQTAVTGEVSTSEEPHVLERGSAQHWDF